MSDRRTVFRKQVVAALKGSEKDFSFADLVNSSDIPRAAADGVAEELLIQLCVNSLDDRILADNERDKLDKLARLCEIPQERQQEILKRVGRSEFETELSYARADGVITDEERAELEQLRDAMGLKKVDPARFGPSPKDQPPVPIHRTSSTQRQDESSSSAFSEANLLRFAWGAPLLVIGLFVAFWLLTVAWGGLVTGSGYVNSMKGPSFLVFYFFVFVVTCAIAAIANAKMNQDGVDGKVAAIAVLAFLAFEGIGVYRIVYGLSHGMQKFTYLVVGMVLGGGILLVTIFGAWTAIGDYGGGGRGGGGGCGGGGCGGGGGGGGGCGGCGGCGG